MFLIQLGGHISSSTPKWLLMHSNLIIIDIVDIARLYSNFLKMLPIIQFHLYLKILLQLHLLQLFSLDVLKHLLSLLLLLHLGSCTFCLHLLDGLHPLIICHVKFGSWVQMYNCISWTNSRNASRRMGCNWPSGHRMDWWFLTGSWPLWVLRPLGEHIWWYRLANITEFQFHFLIF